MISYSATIDEIGTYDSWRQNARQAMSHRIPPDQINWNRDGSLFEGAPLPNGDGPHKTLAPKLFVDIVRSVIWHQDPARFHLLYEALWRLVQREGNPLSPVDPLGHRLARMSKSVRRDLHKMHAFVRFREIGAQTPRRRFIAWFEPDHNIVEPAASFFVSRFSDMDWTILTPKLCALFENSALKFAAGAERPNLAPDASEALWHAYFTHIFNPARTNIRAMLSEMPKKYWRNMPETQLIPTMLKDAETRVNAMRDAEATEPRKGAQRISERYRNEIEPSSEHSDTLEKLDSAIKACQRCGLCEQASQSVCGEGSGQARMMIVGEQPGDQEDLAGRPFVGPAGKVLRRVIEQTEIASADVFLTNAVKHFKFIPRGKRRLHQSPNRDEIDRCRWWLQQEVDLLKPQVILALGASAAFALTGSSVAISKRRGSMERLGSGATIIFSWHPSYILRIPDPARQDLAERQLRADLAQAKSLLIQARD